MEEKGILQAMPVMLAPFTDPLNHEVSEAAIQYGSQTLRLTKSMILHKFIMLMGKGVDAVFIVSPNVRLESEDCKDSGRHLIEFSQVDIEMKGKDKRAFMDLTEELYVKMIAGLKHTCPDELAYFRRKLTTPTRPFKVYESKELLRKYGEGWEGILSKASSEPFWVLDHTREFYDREDEKRRGYYHNYDLIYPEGFGEALSGGEREYVYDEVIRKMDERKMDREPYGAYLELVRQGKIPRTSGGGFGVERLLRWVTGSSHIEEVTLFPRVPGKHIVI